ncbi:small kinetochore-associated protein [Notolabrus celidotus]|uniref:small kinetochore-associated protein n=1 Tax=Notolabrus celidotus TaxID=1203425 RepID=UPI0014900752|nr:small kinetochore-associated protein [Notolabrus celidotus]XP_034555680.1 small kinetochore-associated protein [Notolabrus celidotus]
MSSKIPRGMQPHAEMKKVGHKGETKDTATATQKSDGILKPQRENLPRKNVAPKPHKGISTRYGQQAELKEQNQHLIATNEELQKNLADTQQRVAELELQKSDLEKENTQVQKNLKDCHVLLVASKIDPVLGERVGEAARQYEDQRKEVKGISADLLHELKAFGGIASQQQARLEEIQTSITELAEARGHMMQERENFSLQVAEMEQALEEAEALLL